MNNASKSGITMTYKKANKDNATELQSNSIQNTISPKDSNLSYQNSLKYKMIGLENTINEVAYELEVHKSDVGNLKTEKTEIVGKIEDEKNRMRNDFYKEVKKINDEIEFVIKEQKNHISNLEGRIKLLNTEKDKLCDYIKSLTNRIEDLEKQVGTNIN